jgi:SsrA-binding protein
MEILIQNKKARFNYFILETLEAGIKLKGLEVKAIRAKNITIDEAWVRIDDTATLVGASINPKNISAWEKYEPNQDRILLLKKREIKKLNEQVQKGLTIVPLKVYLNAKHLIKVEIAVAKGKKLYDKRETIKERDLKRYGY